MIKRVLFFYVKFREKQHFFIKNIPTKRMDKCDGEIKKIFFSFNNDVDVCVACDIFC